LFITVHDAIHHPGSHPHLEERKWFRLLDEHHYIHHVDNRANLNFLLPLADWLFGTLRVSLAAKPPPVSPTIAKRPETAIGRSFQRS
jgi:sterol desaturase/sphingolipid hydroxylase (fatty acid hydroxylase superfamily)